MLLQIWLSVLCLLAWAAGSPRLTPREIDEMESYLKVYSCNSQKNRHLHVFTHKFPREHRQRVRWHAPKHNERGSGSGTGAEDDDASGVASRMLFVGGDKVSTNQRFKISDLSYEMCPGSEKDPVKITSMKLLGETIVPGDVRIAFHSELLVDVAAPVKAEVEAYKEIFGTWVRMPCYNDLGSCSYADACLTSRYKPPCPPDFQRDGIPCTCPFKKGVYKSDNLQVYAGMTDPMDLPSWLTDGRYRGEIVYSAGGKRIACIRSVVTVQKV